MSALAVFSYLGHDVRTVRSLDEIWFVASDVARVLGYSEAAAMTRTLDDDEKGLRSVQTPGGDQAVLTINEAGLYSVILRSRVENAREFKRWVTHIVLPEIRRTGSYSAPAPTELSRLDILTMAIESEQRAIAAEGQVAELAPRADAWDDLASAGGDFEVADAAKMLARAGIPTGRTRLFESLAEFHWIYRGGDNKWRAYSTAIDTGYLTERAQWHYHPRTREKVLDTPQVRVTIKGLERLRQRLHIGALQAVSA